MAVVDGPEDLAERAADSPGEDGDRRSDGRDGVLLPVPGGHEGGAGRLQPGRHAARGLGGVIVYHPARSPEGRPVGRNAEEGWETAAVV